MRNGRVLIVLLVVIVVVAAIVLVAVLSRPQPKPVACPSRVTAQADTNFINRSMSDLKSLKLELLQNASVTLQPSNQAIITGTIRLTLGPAVAEPTVAFAVQFAVKESQLAVAVSNLQIISGPAAIPIPDQVKGTLPDSLSRDLARAFAQVTAQVAPKDADAKLDGVRTDAERLMLDFVIPCPSTPIPSPTR